MFDFLKTFFGRSADFLCRAVLCHKLGMLFLQSFQFSAQQIVIRLADRRITLELTDAAVAHLAEAGHDPVYGARPLRRYLQRQLETRLAKALVAGEVADGSTVTVDLVDSPAEGGDPLTLCVHQPVV